MTLVSPPPVAPVAGGSSRAPAPRLVLRAARGPRPTAHLLLPAARCVCPAAHHRSDHGAERLERLLLPAQRRRQLRGGPQAADVGRARSPHGLRRQPHPRALAPSPGLPRLPVLARPAPPDRVHRRDDQRQPELARPRARPDPALGVRQARGLVLWAAHVYANKDRRLDSVHARPGPGRAGPAHRHGAGHRRRGPRHRAGAGGDPARHALGGRRTDAVVRAVVLGARRRRDRAWPAPVPSA